MYRFWAGLIIASGCHVLLFMVPIYHLPETPSRLVPKSGITVGFNPVKPPAPKNAVKAIPPPPRPILPLEKRIEKPPPKKTRAPKLKPKPKPVIRKVKKKPATVKPRQQTPPPPPELAQNRPFDESRRDPVDDSAVIPPANVKTSSTTATIEPQATTAGTPPVIRKAYPKNEGNPPPKYPVLARRRGWEGTVLLSVLVLENGRVGGITVEKSSGYPLLDETALKTVAQYRFEPGLQNEQTTAMRVAVPVHFRLEENQ